VTSDCLRANEKLVYVDVCWPLKCNVSASTSKYRFAHKRMQLLKEPAFYVNVN